MKYFLMRGLAFYKSDSPIKVPGMFHQSAPASTFWSIWAEMQSHSHASVLLTDILSPKHVCIVHIRTVN